MSRRGRAPQSNKEMTASMTASTSTDPLTQPDDVSGGETPPVRDLTGQIADRNLAAFRHKQFIAPLDEMLDQARRDRRAHVEHRDDAVAAAGDEAMRQLADVAGLALTPGYWEPEDEVETPDGHDLRERCEWVPGPRPAPAETVRVPVDLALQVLDPQDQGLHVVVGPLDPHIDWNDAAAVEAGRVRREIYLNEVRSGVVEVEKPRLQAAYAALLTWWRTVRDAEATFARAAEELDAYAATARARRARLQRLADRGVA